MKADSTNVIENKNSKTLKSQKGSAPFCVEPRICCKPADPGAPGLGLRNSFPYLEVQCSEVGPREPNTPLMKQHTLNNKGIRIMIEAIFLNWALWGKP